MDKISVSDKMFMEKLKKAKDLSRKFYTIFHLNNV